MQINIYTDGACKGNPGPGGYGVILEYKNSRKELNCGYKLTTNNRMELLAVIIGLEEIKKEKAIIQVYSDSKYVVEAIEKGWVFNWIRTNKKDAKNMDLWKRFVSLYKLNKINFVWIKGHADNELNNRCDVLATTASAQKNLPDDLGYGK